MEPPPEPQNSVVDLIGATPLIRLKRASEETGCTILGKAEFLNPGLSVKDRAALYIIRDAERRGTLKPGGRIVEGTAGNTGIGLALVGNALGYQTTIVIPRTQSQEKKDAIRLLGAELVEVDAVPAARSQSLCQIFRTPRRRAQEARTERRNLGQPVRQHRQPPGALSKRPAAKSGNRPTARSMVHLRGRHGRHAGRRRPGAQGAPRQRIHRHCRSDGRFALSIITRTASCKAEGNSITEGIGQSRVTANLEGAPVDDAFQVEDAEMLPILFDLVREEGLCLGGSSGINIAGAMKLARALGPGKTIVTILCDLGARYQSKLYNPDFLRPRGLPCPPWME